MKLSFTQVRVNLITTLVLLFSYSHGQPILSAYGNEGFEKGSAMKRLADGGFILAGETESYGLTERNILLVRTDSTGNVMWSKHYGGPERETVNDIVITNSGGFLMAAEKYQPNQQEGENLTLLQTNAAGSLQWKRVYAEGGNETEGFSIQPMSDGGYVIAGMIKNMNTVSSTFFTMSAEDQGLYLLKVDARGNKQWSRKLVCTTTNTSSTGTSIILLKDGNLLVTGNTTRIGKTDKRIEKPAQSVNTDDKRNILLVKLRPNGSLIWSKEFEANTISMGYSVIEKSSGGFVLAGNTNVVQNNLDIFLMDLDASGNVLWAKTYGGPKFESVADLIQTSDGNYIVSGMTYSYGNGANDVLNFKVDRSGNLMWISTVGGGNEDYPAKIIPSGNGYYQLASSASNGTESFDMLLLSIDDKGNGACWTKHPIISTKLMITTVKTDREYTLSAVELGITPPNMKKVDEKNIEEKAVNIKRKSICQP